MCDNAFSRDHDADPSTPCVPVYNPNNCLYTFMPYPVGRREAENVCRSGNLHSADSDRGSYVLSHYVTTETAGHLPSVHSEQQLNRLVELAVDQDIWIGAQHIGK